MPASTATELAVYAEIDRAVVCGFATCLTDCSWDIVDMIGSGLCRSVGSEPCYGSVLESGMQG